MRKYIIRLDDAASKMNIEKWDRMENLLEQYEIKPLVGVIPNCKDPMMECYAEDGSFWKKIEKWEAKGWIIALHGYEHVYCSSDGGVNPVNQRSEFAGISLEEQKRKIREGVKIFREHGLEPQVFFAPSHTFDKNTIEALKIESNVIVISDTIANKPYSKYGMVFIPQQSGCVRKMALDTVTFCYHPNVMEENDFEKLEHFLQKYSHMFVSFPLIKTSRKKSPYDYFLEKLYFIRRG